MYAAAYIYIYIYIILAESRAQVLCNLLADSRSILSGYMAGQVDIGTML